MFFGVIVFPVHTHCNNILCIHMIIKWYKCCIDVWYVKTWYLINCNFEMFNGLYRRENSTWPFLPSYITNSDTFNTQFTNKISRFIHILQFSSCLVQCWVKKNERFVFKKMKWVISILLAWFTWSQPDKMGPGT